MARNKPKPQPVTYVQLTWGQAATIDKAATIIETDAECLKDSHVLANGEWPVASKEDRAVKMSYEHMVQTARELREIIK